MSFVPVKGLEQQGLSMLHSARSQLIGQRTQMINDHCRALVPASKMVNDPYLGKRSLCRCWH
jgi:transposase